jgi:hypothetical protein
MDIEQNLRKLLQSKQAVVDLFRQLNDAHVRWAIYAGCATALLTGNRTPTDIDIIVHDDDFDAAVSLLSGVSRYDNQEETVTTSEGEQIGFIASGVVEKIGGTDIDLMAKASFELAGTKFPIRLTDLAAQARSVYQIEDTAVYVAHPFDTILIKAFMRRGPEQSKFDLSDAQALCRVVKIDGSYKQLRLQEVGQTDQVMYFLEKAGC